MRVGAMAGFVRTTLLALFVCSPLANSAAPEPASAPTAAAAPADAIDPAHLARIERLIEVSGLPEMIDGLAEPAGLQQTFTGPELTLLQQVASYAAWRNSGDLWRAELRQRLNAGQAEAIIAYYRTAAGQRIAACLAAEPEHWGLRICESTLPDTLRPVSDAFNASDAGRAWALIGDQRPVPVLSQATCDGLRREPEVLRSLAKLCRRDREYDPCIFVDDADGTPRIDSAACAGDAPRPE